MKYKRIFLLICDSLGIGNGLDANNYDDEGANTLKHICDECNLSLIHISEPTRPRLISYAVFCLKKKK